MQRHVLGALLGSSILYVVFFGVALFEGRILAPADAAIQNLPNYASPRTLWTTLLFSGYPAYADPQAAFWYPPSLLFSRISNSWNAFVLFAYVLASSGTYLYVIRISGSVLGACIAALVYGSSGFFMINLGHTGMIHTAAWIPLILWSLEELRREPSARYFLLGAVATGHCALAGHPQIFAYAMLLCAAYAVFMPAGAATRRFDYTTRALACLFAGLGLAGILLVPMLELVQLSVRSSMTYTEFMYGSLRFAQLVQLFFPYAFGGWSASVLPGGDVIPYVGRENIAQSTGFVGLLPLLLAGLALARCRADAFVRFWGVVAILALLLALGRFVGIGSILYLVPGLDRFRIPSRHLVELSLAIAVLSAIGVVHLGRLELPSKRAALLRASRNLGIGLALVTAAFAAMLHTGYWEEYRHGVETSQLWPWRNRLIVLQWGVLLLGCAALWWWARRASRLTAGCLVAAIAMDLASFGYFAEWRTSPRPSELELPAALVPYRDSLDETFQRIVSPGSHGPADSAQPNSNRLWGIASASGYNPLLLARYAALTGVGPWGLRELGALSTEDRSLDLLSVRYLMLPRTYLGQLEEQEASERWRLVGESVDSLIFENTRAMPRAWLVSEVVVAPPKDILRAIVESELPDGRSFDPTRTALVEEVIAPGPLCAQGCGRVELVTVSESSLTLRVETQGPAYLVLSDIHYPGWLARIDGETAPIHRTNYCLRGLQIGPGSHTIEFEFRPSSLCMGGAISVTSLILSCLYALKLSRR